MLINKPVTPISDQPSPVEHMVTEDRKTRSASESPAKPPWFNWKLLKFVAVPIVFIMLGLTGVGPKLRESIRSNSATKPITQIVSRQTVPTSITANGIVKADRSINLSPKLVSAEPD